MADGTMANGMWCHIEIPTKNAEKSKSFYGNLFGWTFQDVPMGDKNYTLYFTGNGGIGGGIFDPPEGVPRQMVSYINVEEIEPIVEKAEKNGGKVLIPKQEVPGTGWFALVADPDGNAFGVWKQNPQGH